MKQITLELSAIDWILIVVYLAFTAWIALKYASSSGKSLADFFLGGRSLPWWVAGISMVATTFAADTPLAVTELVATNGISGNWLWWNMMVGGMLTVFFFARLWRRAEVLTEVEFVDLRYSGRPARFLRSFKAIYLGMFMNVLVIGWVNLALQSILEEFFGLSGTEALLWMGATMLFTAVYSAISGLKGVAITDLVQFIIAMGGSIILAVVIVNSEKIGGISGLQEKLVDHPNILNFIPNIGQESASGILSITFGTFVAYLGFQWWASWYPGAEPGGGGYIAQRMMSAKSERDSVFATLFFQIAHYAIRPWPWILVALCTVVLYPDLEPGTEKMGYVMAMKEFLPNGLRGLLLVAFLAAYMSTISTQLNWGASYIVNDFYKPLVDRKHGTEGESREKQWVRAGRITTLILMAISLYLTTLMESISGVWAFMIECGAGLGLVLILRWFWWRINAWSEIAAMVTPFLVYGFFQWGMKGILFVSFIGKVSPMALLFWEGNVEYQFETYYQSFTGFPISYFWIIGITTVVWLMVTFMTQPEPKEKLLSFYKQVRPGGLWKHIQIESGLDPVPSRTIPLILCWFLAVIMTYSILFSSGKLLFGQYSEGLWLLLSAAVSGTLLVLVSKKWNIFSEK